MEMLAIVAQYQPVTRAEIEEIRGASLSQASIDLLLEAGLVAPKGVKNAPGGPTLWVTTAAFLAHFGLNSLRDVPGGGTLLLESALAGPAPLRSADGDSGAILWWSSGHSDANFRISDARGGSARAFVWLLAHAIMPGSRVCRCSPWHRHNCSRKTAAYHGARFAPARAPARPRCRGRARAGRPHRRRGGRVASRQGVRAPRPRHGDPPCLSGGLDAFLGLVCRGGAVGSADDPGDRRSVSGRAGANPCAREPAPPAGRHRPNAALARLPMGRIASGYPRCVARHAARAWRAGAARRRARHRGDSPAGGRLRGQPCDRSQKRGRRRSDRRPGNRAAASPCAGSRRAPSACGAA
jgi:hypothetical protein